MRSRVLFGGIWHETNSFCPVATDLDAFRRFALVEGEALLSAYQGTNTEIGGFVAEAKQQDFELIPTLFAGAIPSGLVSRAALNHLVGTITARVRQGGFDGVFLAVHGAMVAEGIWEADAYIVQQVRDAIGPDVPLVVTFDLHGNISPPLVDAADVLIGYDTLPHVDMAERGREAAQILRRLLDGEPRPHKAFRKLPMLTVPQMQGTEAEPMREIMAELHEIERRRDIVTASVAPGFPYTDVPHLGMAVLAYGDGADLAVERTRRTDLVATRAVPAASPVARRSGAPCHGGTARSGLPHRTGGQCWRRCARRRHDIARSDDRGTGTRDCGDVGSSCRCLSHLSRRRPAFQW